MPAPPRFPASAPSLHGAGEHAFRDGRGPRVRAASFAPPSETCGGARSPPLASFCGKSRRSSPPTLTGRRPSRHRTSTSSGPPKPRALVVDDDAAIARGTARVLKYTGFGVASSNSGAHALERIRRGERFALVVSDVRMPGISGVEFYEAARALLARAGERARLCHGRAWYRASRAHRAVVREATRCGLLRAHSRGVRTGSRSPA